VQYFNRIGVHYEAVYHHIVRKREEIQAIFDDDYIDTITAGLISFDMQRMMGSNKYLVGGDRSWSARLKSKLETHRPWLESLRSYSLQDIDLENATLRDTITTIFDSLSKPGSDGLSKRNKKESFSVGASKILHFLIPDLFVIVDSNSKQELIQYHDFPKSPKINGNRYLQAMKLYQMELNIWKECYSDNRFDKLLQTDDSWQTFLGERQTPLPRIMDKCTFVGEVFPSI